VNKDYQNEQQTVSHIIITEKGIYTFRTEYSYSDGF